MELIHHPLVGHAWESHMPSPTASDLRVFVPAKDFSISKAFYRALGWKLNWEDAELAEMEIAD